MTVFFNHTVAYPRKQFVISFTITLTILEIRSFNNNNNSLCFFRFPFLLYLSHIYPFHIHLFSGNLIITASKFHSNCAS